MPDGTSDGRALLAGIRVVDFSTMMAGPYATRLFADLGAEVVKVESPTGDMVRTAPPLREGASAYWSSLNVGKRSVVLDMKKPEGRDAAAALVAGADVVVENFRPGVMARFGLDHASLAGARPDLVYCSISGYGQTGPWIDRPANAQAVHAISGFDLANLALQDGLDTPLTTGIFVADALGGALAFGAVLAALRGREATGEGRHLDVSLLDGLMSLMTYEVQAAQFPVAFERRGYPPVPARDGWVMVAPTSDQHARRVFDVIGRPELAADERFATTAARWANIGAFSEVLGAWTRQRGAAECEELLNAAGVASSRYLTVAEALDSPQVQHRGSLAEGVDDGGAFRFVDLPFQMTVPGADGPAPGTVRRAVAPGADTRAVLADVLGEQQAEAAIRAGAALAPDEG